MAVFPIPFPSVAPATQKLWLTNKQTVHLSPYSGKQQATNLFAQWNLEIAWSRMTMEEAAAIDAWIASLEGQIGTFRYEPHQARQSTLTGKALNLAAYAESNTVEITGWTPNAASTLYAGQFIQIGNQLLRLTSVPQSADGSGCCTVEFAPRLRANFPRYQAVIFDHPKGTFRLSSSEGAGSTLDPDRLPELPVITAIEAL